MTVRRGDLWRQEHLECARQGLIPAHANDAGAGKVEHTLVIAHLAIEAPHRLRGRIEHGEIEVARAIDAFGYLERPFRASDRDVRNRDRLMNGGGDDALPVPEERRGRGAGMLGDERRDVRARVVVNAAFERDEPVVHRLPVECCAVRRIDDERAPPGHQAVEPDALAGRRAEDARAHRVIAQSLDDETRRRGIRVGVGERPGVQLPALDGLDLLPGEESLMQVEALPRPRVEMQAALLQAYRIRTPFRLRSDVPALARLDDVQCELAVHRKIEAREGVADRVRHRAGHVEIRLQGGIEGARLLFARRQLDHCLVRVVLAVEMRDERLACSLGNDTTVEENGSRLEHGPRRAEPEQMQARDPLRTRAHDIEPRVIAQRLVREQILEVKRREIESRREPHDIGGFDCGLQAVGALNAEQVFVRLLQALREIRHYIREQLGAVRCAIDRRETLENTVAPSHRALP